jgi:8-amino-7-oxononanoate synthase
VSDLRQWTFIDKALNTRKSGNRFRTLRSLKPVTDSGAVVKEGERVLINFSSNDYLGLSRHPAVIERAREYLEQYGAGSTASRLISGTYFIHERLEEKLARFTGREAALLFNSGFQANSTILGTLAGRTDHILADKLSHNSLLQGGLLARASLHRFNHNDLRHLETLLKKYVGEGRTLIVTETVFSMDGDRAPLGEIVELAGRYDALLFVDDAHAIGAWGAEGRGFAADFPQIDLILGTFGKAFGSFGSFVACSKQMRDFLINFCPGFIYTTALPPPIIGAIDAALDLIPEMEDKRMEMHRLVEYCRQRLHDENFSTGTSESQIIPVIIGEEQKALELSSYLEEHGILATAIRPPTVPEGSSRIRLTISVSHTKEHIDQLLKIIGMWNEKY